MATFKPVIRVRSKKIYHTVFIRISHNKQTDYIKTSMLVPVSAADKTGNITDWQIMGACAIIINGYIERLNSYDTSKWTVSEVKQYLLTDAVGISFSKYAGDYMLKMSRSGRYGSLKTYRSAFNSLSSFMGCGNIMFSDITSKVIRNWIESISGLKRAKNMYPILIKKMFDDGCTEYNDYDNNFIRIKNQPFRAVKIPGIEPAAKRYADPDTVRRILSVASVYPLDILARDVAMLVLCLAGINAIDLYGMSTDCLQDGYLCYNRSKTKYSRSDKAYFRIRVPEIILPLLKKYRGHGSLFNFSETYADPDIFSTQVNKGLKRLCSGAGVPKITVYWLRHTWATIARNFCGCSIEDVAFCLNHTSAHRVTEDYIEKSFDLVDEVNEKVLKVIFP